MNEDNYWETNGMCHCCGGRTTIFRDTCYSCYMALKPEIERLNVEYLMFRRNEAVGAYYWPLQKYGLGRM